MGTWISIIGVIIAIIVWAIILWHFHDTIGGVICSVVATLLVLATSLFIAAHVDPTFPSGYKTVSCVECGNKMNSNDTFCSECGLKLQEEKHCTECSEQISANHKFCPECGTEVKE